MIAVDPMDVSSVTRDDGTSEEGTTHCLDTVHLHLDTGHSDLEPTSRFEGKANNRVICHLSSTLTLLPRPQQLSRIEAYTNDEAGVGFTRSVVAVNAVLRAASITM
jgi:hypothetical protein